MKKFKWIVPTIYILFLMLPIYWLLNMSFKTTTEIINTYSLWPQKFTFENYITIFTDSTWYTGYLNSIYYVVMNTVLSVSAALPAAYAFSRYKFLGDKTVFLVGQTEWHHLTPFSILFIYKLIRYSCRCSLSHCLFNIPLLDFRRIYISGTKRIRRNCLR